MIICTIKIDNDRKMTKDLAFYNKKTSLSIYFELNIHQKGQYLSIMISIELSKPLNFLQSIDVAVLYV